MSEAKKPWEEQWVTSGCSIQRLHDDGRAELVIDAGADFALESPGHLTLAAAAPELYRALDGLTVIIDDWLAQWEGDLHGELAAKHGVGEIEGKNRLVAALTALRKARGEQP